MRRIKNAIIHQYNKIRSILSSRMSGLFKRILKGSFWVMLGTVLSKLLVFCATIVVVRILGKNDYGQLSIIRSTIQMFLALSASGSLGATTTIFIAKYRSTDANKAANVYIVANTFAICVATITSILILIFAKYIAFDMLKAPDLLTDIQIAAVILFFSLLNGAQTGTLAGFEDFKRIAFSSFLVGILELCLLSAGALIYGVRGAILGYGVAYCFAFLYNSYYIRKHIKSLGANLKTTIKELKLSDFKLLYEFSLPIALISWISMPCLWYTKTFLVNHAGFEEMALYDVSDQWRAQVVFIPTMLAQVLLPILSNSIANKDRKSTVNALKINLKLNGGLTLLIAIIIALLSPFILQIYGPEYANNIPLILLAFTGFVYSISNVCGSYIFSSNKAWSMMKINTAWASVLVVVSILLINRGLGAIGLAVAYLLADTTRTLLMAFKTFRMLHHGESVAKV